MPTIFRNTVASCGQLEACSFSLSWNFCVCAEAGLRYQMQQRFDTTRTRDAVNTVVKQRHFWGRTRHASGITHIFPQVFVSFPSVQARRNIRHAGFCVHDDREVSCAVTLTRGGKLCWQRSWRKRSLSSSLASPPYNNNNINNYHFRMLQPR